MIEPCWIPLAGARNARDLGGYPAASGTTTRKGVFVRMDSTASLTPDDISRLAQWGVTLAVDLRSPAERQAQPSRLEGVPGIRYFPVSMIDGIQSAAAGEAPSSFPSSLRELYLSFLRQRREQYRMIFEEFDKNPGASLFHCTAGKDRTGVLAMLLLRLAGVPSEVAAADYAATDAVMRDTGERELRWALAHGLRLPPMLLRAPEEEMAAVIERLDAEYGGARGYLLGCGLSGALLDRIIRRFVR